ncbi:MAG: mechanosensitive ion channel family protein, partial [Proteobacteria bacterium]
MQQQQAAENTDFFTASKTYLIDLVNNPEIVLPIIKGLLLAILIYWVGKKVARWLSKVSSKAVRRANGDQILSGFVSKMVYYLLLAMVIIMALTQLGFQTTSLIAVMGAAGLAIGLALKDSLANFAAGIMLVMFRPFRIGDFVDVTDVSGTVKEIKLFSTYLRTTDNKNLIIPNSQIINDVITNYSAQDTRRIDLVIGVSYDDDIKTAK